jgi:hypothetical protein
VRWLWLQAEMESLRLINSGLHSRVDTLAVRASRSPEPASKRSDVAGSRVVVDDTLLSSMPTHNIGDGADLRAVERSRARSPIRARHRARASTPGSTSPPPVEYVVDTAVGFSHSQPTSPIVPRSRAADVSPWPAPADTPTSGVAGAAGDVDPAAAFLKMPLSASMPALSAGVSYPTLTAVTWEGRSAGVAAPGKVVTSKALRAAQSEQKLPRVAVRGASDKSATDLQLTAGKPPFVTTRE